MPSSNTVPDKNSAAAIATQLNETDPGALAQISRIVERMGDEFVTTALADTLRLEAEGVC